jgi:TPR repeat protein
MAKYLRYIACWCTTGNSLGDVGGPWHNEEMTMKNGRDYWLCSTDGTVEFHYPRAETGDPHGEYDLGRMYYDGAGVLQDQQRGLALIRSAAAKGYKQAVRFLERIESVAEQ